MAHDLRPSPPKVSSHDGTPELTVSRARTWLDAMIAPFARLAHDRRTAERKFGRDVARLTGSAPAGNPIDRFAAAPARPLCASEMPFWAMADSMPTLVWMADTAGNVFWYNRRWQDYCGVTPAEMLRRGWQSVHDPALLAETVARWDRCIAAGSPFEMTFALRGADGVPRTFLTRMQPLRDAAGQITYWVGSHSDTTETEAADAANARLAAIVTSSNDAIVSFDAESGRIMTWNKGAERLFGYTEAEAVGGPVELLVPRIPPDGETTGVFAWAMSGRPVVEHETVRVTRSGEAIPVSVTAARMFSSDGHVIGVSAIFRDLRPRALVEAALRESEEHLRQAQKLEAIGRLAAGVAHDFNNVLQSISGGLELVLDEVEAGTAAHGCAEIALGSARRGAYLTNHLLSYARKQMLQPTRIDITLFLEEMRKLLAHTLGPHIHIDVRTQPAAPPVLVDPGQLQTALLNLAINASHAMARGGTLTLESHHERQEDGRHFVVVAVHDTGSGMDPATLAQAFEPFFTTKGLDGTGLGLSMVQGFAVQSGGAARISSRPGHGTTVELRLPSALDPQAGAAPARTAAAPRTGSGRILLVDDTVEVLTTVSTLLERSGFDVVPARSSRHGLDVLAAGERFDILVTDYAMPILNGVDLVERARQIQPGLGALIISGFAEPTGTEPLPAHTGLLQKPFERHQLVDAVLQILADT